MGLHGCWRWDLGGVYPTTAIFLIKREITNSTKPLANKCSRLSAVLKKTDFLWKPSENNSEYFLSFVDDVIALSSSIQVVVMIAWSRTVCRVILSLKN